MSFRTKASVLAAFLVLLLPACENGPGDSMLQDDVAEIRRFLATSGEAVNAGDVEAEVDRFTEDGIYMWPDAPAIVGREALTQWFEQRFQLVHVQLGNRSEELVISGNWAFDRGTYTAWIKPKDGVQIDTVVGKYLNVLRRQPDGSWRVARRIRNRDHPPRGG
jgi:ketosteroid isomerase-like protein